MYLVGESSEFVDTPRFGRGRWPATYVGLRFVTYLLGATLAAALLAVVSAQSDMISFPGDPTGPDDLVFVDIDSGYDTTCGVTAAENIRCWGDTRWGPIWAEGFTDIATGATHTCGLRLDGTVQCWGNNNSRYNQLVQPTNDDGSAIKFKAIDSLTDHTCGIKDADDGVVCWGRDFSGQSSGTFVDPPFNVAYDFSDGVFAHISTGANHTCGVLKDGEDSGKLRCWGNNLDGSSRISETPVELVDSIFKSVEAGSNFTCVLIGEGIEDGKVVCWGGIIAEFPSQTPSEDTFVQISAGRYHACGVKTDGTAVCWGALEDTNLGFDFDFGQVDVPPEYSTATFSKVVAARYHSCGILDGRNGQTNGEIVCWGEEFEYDPVNPQLVRGSRTTPPDAIDPPPGTAPELAAGWRDNCVLTTDGDLSCWGGSRYAPRFVEGPFAKVAINALHVCAVYSDTGRVRCWGLNNNLQASGSSPGLLSPNLQADSQIVENLTTDYTFKSVAVGLLTSCGILDGREGGDDGTVICWGHSREGQGMPPTDVTFESISVSYYHGCGLLDDQGEQTAGHLVCWGGEDASDYDVRGIVFGLDPRADFGQADVPAHLAEVVFVSVSAGRYHTCAVRSDTGAVECWGRQELAVVPSSAQGLEFSSVSVSDYFSCGVTADNLVKCWGPSSLNLPDSQNPVPAINLNQFHVPDDFVETEFASVSAGRHHVCATQSDGKILCWGADADPSTPEIDLYDGARILNVRQAWVPPSLRARAALAVEEEEVEDGPRLLPTSKVRILRIEPGINGVSIGPDEEVLLSVDVWGRQDIFDNELADRGPTEGRPVFTWITHRDGSFSEAGVRSEWRNGVADDRKVIFTAPSIPGSFLVEVRLEDSTDCLAALEGETATEQEARCSARFDVTVTRRTAPPISTTAPVNPRGPMPQTLTDSQGVAYAVFTPVEGGSFAGEGYSLTAGPGAVANGEFIGIAVKPIGDASSVASTWHRYTFGGRRYAIGVIDAEGETITEYSLNHVASVCVPLPDELRANISDIVMAATRSGDGFTVLSTRVRITPDGVAVCGNISTLPADVTVGRSGPPLAEDDPIVEPAEDEPLPDTGGSAPASTHLVLLLILGSFALLGAPTIGVFVGRLKRDV